MVYFLSEKQTGGGDCQLCNFLVDSDRHICRNHTFTVSYFSLKFCGEPKIPIAVTSHCNCITDNTLHKTRKVFNSTTTKILLILILLYICRS